MEQSEETQVENNDGAVAEAPVINTDEIAEKVAAQLQSSQDEAVEEEESGLPSDFIDLSPEEQEKALNDHIDKSVNKRLGDVESTSRAAIAKAAAPQMASQIVGELPAQYQNDATATGAINDAVGRLLEANPQLAQDGIPKESIQYMADAAIGAAVRKGASVAPSEVGGGQPVTMGDNSKRSQYVAGFTEAYGRAPSESEIKEYMERGKK